MDNKLIFLVFLALLGVLLTALGASALIGEKCDSLPQWMIVAGPFLLIISLASTALFVRKTKSIVSLGGAFCCALLLFILGLLLWLGLWVAGTYLAVAALQDLKVEVVQQEGLAKCDNATLGGAAFVLLVVWLLFIGVGVKKTASFLNMAKEKPTATQAENNHEEEVCTNLFS